MSYLLAAGFLFWIVLPLCLCIGVVAVMLGDLYRGTRRSSRRGKSASWQSGRFPEDGA
jgi:hypothetical protein